MRDRVEGCLKSWLKRGRQSRDLLSPGLSLADGETLLNHFRSSLSKLRSNIFRKVSRSKNEAGESGYLLWLPASSPCFRWPHSLEFGGSITESLRASTQEFGKLERKLAELAKTDLGGNQTELKEAEEKTQLAQHDAEISAAQQSATEAQLEKAQELAKQNADQALTQKNRLESSAQRNSGQAPAGAAERRSSLDPTGRLRKPRLKQTQDKLQQAQQNADAASNDAQPWNGA